MSKTLPKIKFNYSTTPTTNTYKPTFSLTIDDLSSKDYSPIKQQPEQTLEPIVALMEQNEVEVTKETVKETVADTVKQTVNPNPEKAEEDKQPPKQKAGYVYTLIPQQPAPNKPTCSFFTSLFSSCKQPPQRCYSLNE